MLSAGQVDAVSGFSYLAGINLRDRGVPADDLTVLRYADYGCEAYGLRSKRSSIRRCWPPANRKR